MNKCIQNYAVPKKEQNIEKAVVTLRLAGADAVRWHRIMDIAKARDHYISASDVLRELLGLTKPQGLTVEDMKFFRTGDKGSVERPSGTLSGNLTLTKNEAAKAKLTKKSL